MTTTTPLREPPVPADPFAMPDPAGYEAKPDDELPLLDILIVVAEHKRVVALIAALTPLVKEMMNGLFVALRSAVWKSRSA